MGKQKTISTDTLFLLVKSLTKREKANFTTQAFTGTKKGDSDYLRLFRFLQKMKFYDEEIVKEHFKEEDNFIRNYSKKKNELKNKILESLVHGSKSREEDKLRKTISYLPILWEKGLNKELEKRLESAKKIAVKKEMTLILLELSKWEYLLLKNKTNLVDKMEAWVIAQEKILNDFMLEKQLNLLKIKFDRLVVKDRNLHRKDSKMVFEKIIIDPILSIEGKQLSLNAKRDYHYLKSNFYKYNKRLHLAFDHAKNLIELFTSKPIQYEEKIAYKNALCNFLVICDHAKKQKEFEQTIDRLSKIYINDTDDIIQFNTIHFIALRFYINTLNLKEAIKIIDKIKTRWEDLNNVINQKRIVAYCYNILIVYWFVGDLNNAVIWLEKLKLLSSTKEGKDLINTAKILQLPIYYDLKDSNFDNKLESTRKTFPTKNKNFKSRIRHYFSLLYKSVSNKERKKIIQEMYDELSSIKNSSQEIQILGLEELLMWCQAKIENRKNIC